MGGWGVRGEGMRASGTFLSDEAALRLDGVVIIQLTLWSKLTELYP